MITREKIFQVARLLKSEDGENPEYDRALVEMTIDLLGMSMDEKQGVYLFYGIPFPSTDEEGQHGLAFPQNTDLNV